MVDFKPRTAEFDNCLKDKGFEPKKHFKERHDKKELQPEVKE